MRGKFQFVVSAMLMSVALVGLAGAKKPKPVPCQPDRYLLPASIGNLTGDAAPEIPLALQPGQSMLGSCPLITRPFKANKKGVTTVIAKSPPGATCGPGSFKKILVKVTLPSGCQSATVKVRPRSSSFRHCRRTAHSAATDKSTRGVARSVTVGMPGRPPATATARASRSDHHDAVDHGEHHVRDRHDRDAHDHDVDDPTTLVGACFDIDGHVTAQACTSKDDCPRIPTGIPVTSRVAATARATRRDL